MTLSSDRGDAWFLLPIARLAEALVTVRAPKWT